MLGQKQIAGFSQTLLF